MSSFKSSRYQTKRLRVTHSFQIQFMDLLFLRINYKKRTSAGFWVKKRLLKESSKPTWVTGRQTWNIIEARLLIWIEMHILGICFTPILKTKSLSIRRDNRQFYARTITLTREQYLSHLILAIKMSLRKNIRLVWI